MVFNGLPERFASPISPGTIKFSSVFLAFVIGLKNPFFAIVLMAIPMFLIEVIIILVPSLTDPAFRDFTNFILMGAQRSYLDKLNFTATNSVLNLCANPILSLMRRLSC